jgi:formylglycine-generating enzyme required for sulfatase activity
MLNQRTLPSVTFPGYLRIPAVVLCGFIGCWLRAETEPDIKSPPTSESAAAGLPETRKIPDLQLELIWVAPGQFEMGSPPDSASNKAEKPQTHVTLTKGFWLGKTEVTQSQYQAVVGSNPSTFQSLGPDAPVERVSWIDAMAFCEKLTARERAAGRLPEGYRYTLPTEAQWEYACRAGTTGDYSREPETTSWNRGNSGDSTHLVATKQPNPWGFYDMTGNVLEWCFDWYGDYPGGSVTDPRGPERGYYRIARGGSWRADVQVGRSAARSGGSAGRLDYTLGFRVALAALPKP